MRVCAGSVGVLGGQRNCTVFYYGGLIASFPYPCLSGFFLCFGGWLVGWFFKTRVTLCSPSCPGIGSIDKPGLEPRDLPAFASQVLGSVCNHLLAWICFILSVLFLQSCPVIYTRMPSNSEMNCLCLLSSGMKGMCHDTWLVFEWTFYIVLAGLECAEILLPQPPNPRLDWMHTTRHLLLLFSLSLCVCARAQTHTYIHIYTHSV